jgi:hypothetical protein
MLTALVLICLVSGPFTCFVSWGLACQLALWGLPVHLLALTFGRAAAESADPGGNAAGSAGAGGFGMILSVLILAYLHPLLPF